MWKLSVSAFRQFFTSWMECITSDVIKIVPNTVVKHYWVWYDFKASDVDISGVPKYWRGETI